MQNGHKTEKRGRNVGWNQGVAECEIMINDDAQKYSMRCMCVSGERAYH